MVQPAAAHFSCLWRLFLQTKPELEAGMGSSRNEDRRPSRMVVLNRPTPWARKRINHLSYLEPNSKDLDSLSVILALQRFHECYD